MLKIRAHHLLCTMLFEGKGYNGEFTSSLSKIAYQLQNENLEICVISTYDDICTDCPNKNDVDEEYCLNARVSKKDKGVLNLLKLCEGQAIKYYDAIALISQRISESDFEESCKNCIWYKNNVCKYDKLIENIGRVLA